MTEEIEWREISELNGRYEISNTGIIKNKKSGRVMKLFLRNDYLAVALYNGNKSIQRFVHRLVALEFVKNMYPWINDIVHHLDENKLNPHARNLMWSNQAEHLAIYRKNHAGNTNIDKMKRTLGSPVVEYDLTGNKIAEYRTPQSTGYHNKEFYNCLKTHAPFRGSIYIYKNDIAS